MPVIVVIRWHLQEGPEGIWVVIWSKGEKEWVKTEECGSRWVMVHSDWNYRVWLEAEEGRAER
jgi:hypothetical protein